MGFIKRWLQKGIDKRVEAQKQAHRYDLVHLCRLHDPEMPLNEVLEFVDKFLKEKHGWVFHAP